MSAPATRPVYTLGQPGLADAGMERTVCSGLSLWLPMKDPAQMGLLLQYLQGARATIDEALARLHYVHFSRFLPAPDWSALQVITEFDGEFDAYVLDFVHVLAEPFNKILEHVAGAPAEKVQDRPDLFVAFIRRHQMGIHGPFSLPVRQNSAYRDLTVIDIIGKGGVQPRPTPTTPQAVAPDDVQANLLRGLNADHAWHVGLRIDDVAQARLFLAGLLTGADGCPRVSDSTDWPMGADGQREWPDHQLTVGLTWKGLVWLGISEVDQKAFELAFPAFVRGPDHAGSAARLGDIGSSAPQHWRLGGPRAPVHIVVSLYARLPERLASARLALRRAIDKHSLVPVWDEQAQAMRDAAGNSREHFGYVDGISDPLLHLPGTPAPEAPAQPLAPVGEVLLGPAYTNTYRGTGSLFGLSPALGMNATFAALRLMRQDVDCFNGFLAASAAATGHTTEWIAAKMMGRWRNGVPLSHNPVNDTPDGTLGSNAFDHARRADDTTTFDDDAGLRCPIGAHVRRMNPRSGVAAGQPYSRRMLRRGMPYTTGAGERGLVGLFLCSDLDRQFEFVLRQWGQGDAATSGIRGQQDPIIGAQTTLDVVEDQRRPMDGSFTIPRENQHDLRLKVPRLVHTVGSAYLFMPGIGGLRHLAALTTTPAPAVPQAAPRPRLFDPADHAVYTDPFAYFEALRPHHPVLRLPALRTVWVFSDAAVAEVLARPAQFGRKRPGTKAPPVGLLKMDGKGHAQARRAIGPLFVAATQGLPAQASSAVGRLFGQLQPGPQPVDWVADFARPLATEVFSAWFGLQDSAVGPLLDKAAAVLSAASPHDDRAADLANTEMGETVRQALPRMQPNGLLAEMRKKLVGNNDLQPAEPDNGLASVEFLTQATTLALAGFLPVYWGVSLVTWRLLDNGGALLAALRHDQAITTRAAVAELLRFDTPTPMSARHVQEDCTLGGVQLRRGDKLMLSWASANRDAVRFGADAGTVNFHRQPDAGWSFGNTTATAAGDSFECLGRDLSEAVLGAVVDALRQAPVAPRLPDGQVPDWAPTAMFRALASLPVHLQ